jgi:hypothetical protein
MSSRWGLDLLQKLSKVRYSSLESNIRNFGAYIKWVFILWGYRSGNSLSKDAMDRFCSVVVKVPGYRSRDPGSIPGAARFSEK